MKKWVLLIAVILLSFNSKVCASKAEDVFYIANVGGLYDVRMKKAIEELGEKWPQVLIRLEKSKADEDADIICLYYSDYLQAINEGSIQELDERFSALVSDEIYFDFAEYLEIDEKLYGLPISWRRTQFFINGELAEKCGFDIPNSPYGFEELLYKLEELKNTENVYLMRDCLKYPYLVNSYVCYQYYRNGKVDFQNDDFRRELTAFKELYNKGVIIDNLEKVDAEFLITTNGQDAELILPPVWGESTYELADVYVMCINSGSKNTLIAEDFFEIWMDPEIQNSLQEWDYDTNLLQRTDPGKTVMNGVAVDEYRAWAFDTMIPRNDLQGFVKKCVNDAMIYDYLNDNMSQDELIWLLQEAVDKFQ